MLPCMITGIVFMVFTLILSSICIFNVFFNGNSMMVKYVHTANLGVYVYCQFFNFIYKIIYAKKDLLRTEEEEIDV